MGWNKGPMILQLKNLGKLDKPSLKAKIHFMTEYGPLTNRVVAVSLEKLASLNRVSTLRLAGVMALVVTSKVENWGNGTPAMLRCSEGVRMDLRFFPGREYNAVTVEIPDLERDLRNAIRTGVAQFDGLEIRWKGRRKLGVFKVDDSTGEEDEFRLSPARQRLLARELLIGCNPETPQK